MIIGLTALGGIVLTSFYHGDTAADQAGNQWLHEVAGDCLIISPIAALLGFLFIWFRRRGTSLAINNHKLPVKKF